jgi:hypothetical protein
MAVAAAAGLTAMSWISLAAYAEGEPRVFARLVLSVVASYFVLGLPFRAAVAANALALYAALATARGIPGVVLTHYLLTLGIANVICIAGAWPRARCGTA